MFHEGGAAMKKMDVWARRAGRSGQLFIENMLEAHDVPTALILRQIGHITRRDQVSNTVLKMPPYKMPGHKTHFSFKSIWFLGFIPDPSPIIYMGNSNGDVFSLSMCHSWFSTCRYRLFLSIAVIVLSCAIHFLFFVWWTVYFLPFALDVFSPAHCFLLCSQVFNAFDVSSLLCAVASCCQAVFVWWRGWA